MKLNQLRYVIEVDRCKSLNKASKGLYISQPSLTKAIQELEKELGVIIFNRTNRGVETTLEGQKLVLYAKKLLMDVQKIENGKFLKEEEKKRFFLSAQDNSYVIDAYIKFCDAYNLDDTKIDFCIDITHPIGVVDNVFNRHFDLGIILISSMQKEFWLNVLERKQIEFHSIKQFGLEVILDENDPLADCDVIDLNQLADHTHILFNSNPLGKLNYIDEKALLGFSEEESIIQVHDRGLMYELAKKMKSYIVGIGNKAHFERIGFVCRPLANQNLTGEIGYIKLADIPLSEEAETFVGYFKREVLGTDYE